MGYVDVQLSMLERMKPAQWVPGVRNFHRSTRSFECVPGAFDGDVNTAIDKIDLALRVLTCDSVYVSRVNKLKRKVCVRFLTKAMFLDVLTLQVCTQSKADAQGHISLFVKSESTSLFPAKIPGAPLLGVLSCLAIFLDVGENSFHIQKVKKVLLAQEFIGLREGESDVSGSGSEKERTSRQIVVAPGGKDASATSGPAPKTTDIANESDQGGAYKEINVSNELDQGGVTEGNQMELMQQESPIPGGEVAAKLIV